MAAGAAARHIRATHGWVSVARPLEHDWAGIEELIVDAYRLAAPKQLAKLLAKD
jgi:predicted DNA-binding protein (MmcQ/YjbR family)